MYGRDDEYNKIFARKCKRKDLAVGIRKILIFRKYS
jgi:hypothetical protein